MPVKDRKHMTPDLSSLPEGQKRAVRALISGERARTYPEAAELGGISHGHHVYPSPKGKEEPFRGLREGSKGQESPACCASPQRIRERQGSYQGLVQEGET